MGIFGKAAAERVTEQVDIDALVARLGTRKDELRALVSRRVYTEIRSRDTSELLTLQVTEGDRTRTLSPSPTPEYAAHLFRYMRGQGGSKISCKLEEIVEKAVTDAVTEFYQSEETLQTLLDGLADQLRNRAEIHRILEEELRKTGAYARGQIKDALDISERTTVAEQLADQLGQGVVNVVQETAVGGALAALLAKALAIPAVKVAMMKALSTVLASAAFKKILLVVGKKLGVALFVKLALVKIVGVRAGAMTAVIVIPIVIWFLVHQWQTFPEKVAGKVSKEVADKLVAENDTLAKRIATAFVAAALEVLDDLLEHIHDRLLEEAS
ncbi:hypothetical protein GCM10010106_18550 [Thermopolyspora flexuosa]|uniref:Uncharacterized protein n=1 Tax=Thermopolyspora flexuosa TaxID=103836 RepID=A0A543J406_9ACTN|nr:hypothetical protein [Thermopolyspora flexuosa]TQM77557.1 hypothetical protein FHX40_4324 [Thermopolyspora flexuosa]GGM72457.1 hypothetical protein GCM10010106_18550 [Thermopolyspora flexuosa]